MNELELEPVIKKVAKKNKVGRPCKNPPAPPKPKIGIVDTPDGQNHYIEFLYDNPEVFKKLWAFFKTMFVEKVHMVFMKKCIVIYCNDHNAKNYFRVKIDCTKVNRYFCKKELDIGLLSKNLELVMNTIDKKTYNSIEFVSTCDNIQKNIHIILTNDMDIDEVHKIELIGEYDKSIDDEKFLDDDYTIKFRLNGTYFKKMITNIKSFSDQVSIIKEGPSADEKLTFEYTKPDKKINSSNIINKNSSINLVHTLEEDDTFRTSVKVDYIKPIASAVLNENIEIYADENKKLKFICQMGDAIQIIILTEIIDNRTKI
jgi:hypothetical protein